MTEYADAQRQLEELYAELPNLECKGLCQEACGPIFMSKWEWSRIRKRVKDEKRLRAAPGATVCPLLSGGRCSVYRVRPVICRLWGVVSTMPCPHGCKPDRYLTHFEGKIFLERAQLIATTDKEERLVLLERIEWLKTHPEEEREAGRQYRALFTDTQQEMKA